METINRASCLAINCSVSDGLGKLIIIIVDGSNNIIRHVFTSPSVFSFHRNSAEILNWHRDNIISLIAQYDVQLVSVKKTERTSFYSKPKNSDIFKLYMEGVMLSLAGTIGKRNQHLYKNEIQARLGDPDIFNLSIPTLVKKFELNDFLGKIPATETSSTKDTILTALASQRS